MNFLKHKNWQLFLVGLFLLLIDFLLKGNDLSSNVHKAGGDVIGDLFNIALDGVGDFFNSIFNLIFIMGLVSVIYLIPATFFGIKLYKKGNRGVQYRNKTDNQLIKEKINFEEDLPDLINRLNKGKKIFFIKRKRILEYKLLYVLTNLKEDKKQTYEVFSNLLNKQSFNLVEELKSLSNNYNKIKKYLYPFICHGICEANYPHKILVTH